MTLSSCRSAVALGVLMAVTAGSAAAQQEQPKIRVVYFSKIKPDRIGDFLSANREIAEAMKKAGSERSYTVWTSLSGEREYALVRYHSKWAELDTPNEPKLSGIAGQLSAMSARVSAAVESQRRVLYSLDQELSLPFATTPDPLVQVLRTWVRPDQLEAYRALVKSEVLPAIKKSGAKTYSFARVRAGGSSYEVNSVIGLDNWAALDGDLPVVKGLGGQAEYQKFLTRVRPLVTRSEYEIYRYLPDQSYRAPMK